MKAKTKFTRLWSILLALVMVVGMLPTVALAAEPATEKADFSTDPTAALNLLNAAKTGTEDSTWDPDTNTLTLNGVNFTTTASTAVKLPEAATIVLNGDNIITSGEATSNDSFGIYAEGSLTIKGAGKLTVTSDTANDDSEGIYAKESIDISGGTVNATGGTATDDSYGIHAGDSIAISGGTVTATGGTASDVSYGIYTKGNITITDGTVTAEGGTATKDSYGIYSKRNTEISGGTVKAYGGDTSSGYSYGIYTDGSLTISDDADVTANGGKANYNSYGIYANTGLTISGDNTVVTATGGEERARKSKGIFVNSNYVTIESGKVEATGGKAGVESYGIEARDNIEISGGTVTATGGEVTSGAFTYSFGIYSNNNVTISNTATVTAKGGETTNYDSTCSHGIYASNGLSISGGTVTAQAGTAKTARAFEKSPSISISLNYWWRTSESDEYTQFSDSSSAYTWSVEHTYVEIRDTAPAAATTYTVTFDANGGTGEMEAATGVSGEYTLPANGFTAPARKRFKCWSVNGAEKAVGATINVTANTTVTAVWETIVTAVWETIPATSTEYDILDGANSSWTQNSDGSLSIRGSGAFSEFVGVKVDGKSVDEQYYTVKEGSTIVTLKAEYLSTLAAGPHTIQLIWKDGTASTTFNINVNNPNTGDNGGLALAAALLALSAAAIAASGFNRKRGKSSR